MTTSSRIWKFPLALTDNQTIRLPVGAVILSAGLDPGDDLCLWVKVDAAEPAQHDVPIRIVGTGNPMPEVGYFVGTVRQGRFMWHVFAGAATMVRGE